MGGGVAGKETIIRRKGSAGGKGGTILKDKINSGCLEKVLELLGSRPPKGKKTKSLSLKDSTVYYS